MPKYDLNDDYLYRLKAITRLLGICGHTDDPETVSVHDLVGLITAFYYPEGFQHSPSPTDAENTLYRVYVRAKSEARAHCYYRDVLKARMEQNG